MGDYLELLPAVDVKGGQAVQLVQGVDGSEKRFGDPLRGCAALAGDRGRVDPPGRPRRRVRSRQQPRAPRRDRRQARHQGRDERRHPRRRVARGRAWRPAAAGSTSAPPRWRTRSGAPAGDRRRTATGSRSGSTYRGRTLRRARLDPGRRRPLRDARRASTPTGCAALRRHRRQQGRHAPAAPTSTCCATVCAAHRPPGRRERWRAPTLDDLEALHGPGRASAWRARSSAPRSTPGPLHARPRRSSSARQAARGPAMSLAVRVIPCLDVDAGRVVKGVNFNDLRDAGDPVELAAAVRRGGRRRAHLPRHHRLRTSGAATMLEVVRAHRRAGLHPAHGRRRRPQRWTTWTRCCGPAPTRSRSTPRPSPARS